MHPRAQNVKFRDQNLTMAFILTSSKTLSEAVIFTDLLPPLLLKKKNSVEEDSSLFVNKTLDILTGVGKSEFIVVHIETV